MDSWPRVDVPSLAELGHAPPLRLHDTATGSLRESPSGGTGTLYVCGITPYDATHLGHANTYLAFDLVQRTWLDCGREALYVQNVTDVDDPLLERAHRDNEDWRDLATREIARFGSDMEALRVLPPQHYVGAVESIELVVEFVLKLKDSGAAYQVDDDWYFEVRRDPTFGEVSGYDHDTMMSLSADRGGDPGRVGKRDPLDCLLWRAERPGEPAWDSALGRGRPGWHIECCAIARQHLGAAFEIQGGGSDLIFPHHEMSAAEAQTAYPHERFALSYAHAGMVGYQGAKMSKSLGNLVFVSALRAADANPAALRLALLSHHYRSDWEWTEADLVGADERLAVWRLALESTTRADAEALTTQVRAALSDDLDTPKAVAILDAWSRRGSRAVNGATEGDAEGAGLVRALLDARLGILLPA